MQQSGGEKKGKAVITVRRPFPPFRARLEKCGSLTWLPFVLQLHARGDYLWAAGSGVDAPLPPSSSSKGSSSRHEVDAVADDLASTTIDPAPKASSSSADSRPASPSPTSTELTPAQVDAALFDALLLAISTSLSSAAFPLPASLLYSSHILPSRPASGPGSTAEVKKSTFKKLDRLVKAAAKKGWLSTKEVKGEVVVVGINAAHPDVEALRPYKTLGMEDRAEQKSAKREEVKEERKKGELEVKELWKLSGDGVKELFRRVEHERCVLPFLSEVLEASEAVADTVDRPRPQTRERPLHDLAALDPPPPLHRRPLALAPLAPRPPPPHPLGAPEPLVALARAGVGDRARRARRAQEGRGGRCVRRGEGRGGVRGAG